MSSSLFTPLLALPTVMTLIGLITALVITIVRRRRIGRAAVLAITGISLLLLDNLLSIALPFATYGWFRYGPAELDSFMMVRLIESTLMTVLWAVGLGLIIAAVFVGRPRPGSPHGVDAPQP